MKMFINVTAMTLGQGYQKVTIPWDFTDDK